MTLDNAHPWPRRLRRVATGRPFLVTAAVIAALFAAYTLAGFLLVPRLIMSYVPRYVERQLDRRAEIGRVRVNPLLFKVEIGRFRLREADGRPLLAFERLLVDFELSSLFHRAWTFREILLDAPRLDVVMARNGRINVADLIDAFPKSKAAPAAPARVVLQHARVSGGTLSFTDLSGRAPQSATVKPVDIELHDVATLRDRRGPYAISATLGGGGVVAWEGEVSLVPLASAGHVRVTGVPLATAWRFFQDHVALAEPGGRLDASTRYEFAYRDARASLKVDGAEVTLADLALAERGGAPLLALKEIRLAGAHGDVLERQLTVPEISARGGRMAVTIAGDGSLSWQHLVAPSAAPAPGSAPPADAAPAPGSTTPADAAPAPTPAAPSWRVTADKVRVQQVALSVADRSHAPPLDYEIGDVSVELSAELATGRAGLTGLIDKLGAKLARVTLAEAGGAGPPVISVDGVSVEGGRVDLAARQISAARVAGTGGTTTAVRAADGSIPFVAIFGPAEPSARTPERSVAAPAVKPWIFRLDKLDAGDHRIAIADRAVTPNVEQELTEVTLTAAGIRSDGKTPIPFQTAFRVGPGGRFSAKGSVAPDGSSAEATVAIARLPLAPAQPYVARVAEVVVRSGEASTTGRFSYRAGRGRPTVAFTGSADVDAVNVVEAASGERVVAWKAMHANRVRFGLAPDRLRVGEVRVTGLDGRLTIERDKRLRIAHLMKDAGSPGAAPGSDAPAPDSARAPTDNAHARALPGPASPGPAFPVGVERVRVESGSMDFSDLSLALPFRARVRALNGVIVGLGSAPGRRTELDLGGQVGEFGSVKVDGALDAFHPKVFTDVDVVFRNVAMPLLTPYSVTFAGRRIAAGTMDVDLQYKIDRGMLKGENKIVLTKLQLGERVESPGATRLPLDLAVAVLSDSQGRIDVAIPVTGDVNSPHFSYGQVMWQALVRLITRAATAPFRALAGLFGGEDEAERLRSVDFEPGLDVVPPPEREQLRRVAELLDRRERLKVIVHGAYDAKADGEALRSRRVREELTRRLGASTKPGEDPGPVAFEQARTQRALEKMLTESAGSQALESVEASFERSSGKKADRANPVLALVGRGSGDRTFYEALFRRLVETAPLAPEELTSLAERRADATARALKERAGTAADRVEVGATEQARADRNAVPARLELGAATS